jgi:hypothetical protein
MRQISPLGKNFDESTRFLDVPFLAWYSIEKVQWLPSVGRRTVHSSFVESPASLCGAFVFFGRQAIMYVPPEERVHRQSTCRTGGTLRADSGENLKRRSGFHGRHSVPATGIGLRRERSRIRKHKAAGGVCHSEGERYFCQRSRLCQQALPGTCVVSSSPKLHRLHFRKFLGR